MSTDPVRDPLDVLRVADLPVDPDPAFAAGLRAQLVRALTTGAPMITPPRFPANGIRQGDVAYVTLEVPDLAAAQTFYGGVLGWRFVPGHSPLGAQVVESAPMVGLAGGAERGGAVLAYRVFDIGDAVDRVRAAGGTATDVEQQSYGRASVCTDTSGHPFWLNELPDRPDQPAVATGARLRQGDLSYITFGVPDGERERAFYAAVLGWTYVGGNPEGLLPRTGMWSPDPGAASASGPASGPDSDSATTAATAEGWPTTVGPVPCFQVDDLAAAVVRVREAGGRIDEPEGRPYGLEAHGYDDQGIELYLHQLTQD